jgi:hypothetical protein
VPTHAAKPLEQKAEAPASSKERDEFMKKKGKWKRNVDSMALFQVSSCMGAVWPGTGTGPSTAITAQQPALLHPLRQRRSECAEAFYSYNCRLLCPLHLYLQGKDSDEQLLGYSLARLAKHGSKSFWCICGAFLLTMIGTALYLAIPSSKDVCYRSAAFKWVSAHLMGLKSHADAFEFSGSRQHRPLRGRLPPQSPRRRGN